MKKKETGGTFPLPLTNAVTHRQNSDGWQSSIDISTLTDVRTDVVHHDDGEIPP